jgi:hypothetical protein
MQDRPLDQAEQDLLALIRALHAEKGPFLRSTLSVVGRGRGLEVARTYNHLKLLGLVEEIPQKPFFLKRLFGAKPTLLLRPVTAAEATAPAPPPAVEAPPPPPAAPAPEPVAPTPAAPKPPKTRTIPMAPDAYTDEIGGQPLAYAPLPLATGLDPELLDGLREMLVLLGMELTMAGEALISDRMAKGASAGEALCQVTLFAFAHAAHHDILAGGPMQAKTLHDYAIEVIGELEKLRDAGEVRPEPFEQDMRAIWALVDKSTDRSPLVAELLRDPTGGAAPPALLPEELRGVEDIADPDLAI